MSTIKSDTNEFLLARREGCLAELHDIEADLDHYAAEIAHSQEQIDKLSMEHASYASNLQDIEDALRSNGYEEALF